MRSDDLIQINLDGISDIEYLCRAWISRPRERAGGVISFSGNYRIGSAGAGDALFMKWKIDEFSEIQEPFRIHGLVVDLTNLNYQWGEDLDTSSRRLTAAGKPVLSVIRPEKIESFSGVLERRNIRTDLNQAISEVSRYLAE
ncbi:hypothetical protein AB0467_00010 [Streptomyces sp. NPDC052095]|uniref:hypothetical protein n=1 Tax=unclassified Streptomyces TaxID=2593676 RepID=UPI00344B53A6